MGTRRPSTSDLGFAIRDFLEEKIVSILTRDGDETGQTFKVEFIDISDIHNPEIHVTTDDGANYLFTLRIFAGGK